MRRQGGFSYPVAMFLVAMVAVLAVRALENVMTAERRERERELLTVGMAYRNAIRSYYDNSPGTAKAYPKELKDLLLDERASRLRRPLRKLYRDPITGNKDWGLVLSEAGAIKGVYSLSRQKPIRTGGFPLELLAFTDAKQYRQWQFVYEPN